MVTTIKGPITFKGGIPISKQIGDLAAGQYEQERRKAVMPFEATGWKSTKMPKDIDMGAFKEKVEDKEEKPAEVKGDEEITDANERSEFVEPKKTKTKRLKARKKGTVRRRRKSK